MAWNDRDYAHRDRPGFGTSPLMWLLTGRVRLFEVWGVTVTAHASMIVVSALVLVFGTPFGQTVADRLVFVVTLFGIVLLHEFGHVWGARATGGEARDVELTPLGGLALAQPAKGWYPHTITIICGPLVNVLICVVAGLVLWATLDVVPLGPFGFTEFGQPTGWLDVGLYAFYVYSISYFLLLFNLLPVFPLDGGQLLQGLLWARIGWFKATLAATAVGLIGAVLMVMYAIASEYLLMAFIGLTCGLTCFQLRRQLQAAGPEAFADQDEPDYMRSVYMDPDEPEKVSMGERIRRKREAARARRASEAARRVEAELDAILAKISATGMASLTASERRALERARAAKSRP